MGTMTESEIESAALARLKSIAWQVAHGQGTGAALGTTAEHRRTTDRHGQQREVRR
jgi:hypothetical protein